MGKSMKIAGWIVGLVALSGVLAADKAKPVPGPGKPYLGVDIAVVQVGTTGKPEWSPTFTLKNLGTKPIRRDLQMIVKANGGVIAVGPLWVNLASTKTLEWTSGPVLANFAKLGDVIEVTIDADNKLAEDNESNNVLSKKITLIFPAAGVVAVKKR
jgi:hypothetical protein